MTNEEKQAKYKALLLWLLDLTSGGQPIDFEPARVDSAIGQSKGIGGCSFGDADLVLGQATAEGTVEIYQGIANFPKLTHIRLSASKGDSLARQLRDADDANAKKGKLGFGKP